MKRIKIKNNAWAIICSAIIGLAYSCSGMLDNIQPYLDEGETIYVGKLDSLTVYPGKNRVKITGITQYGVNQVKCAISWLNPNTLEAESKEFPVDRQNGNRFFEFMLDNLDEGQYDFSVVTFDREANQSIPNTISTYVYGERYEGSLVNRIIREISSEQIIEANGNSPWITRINWNITKNSEMAGCQIEYERSDNSRSILFVDAEEPVTLLSDFKEKGVLRYTTLYKPEENSLDLFYAPEEELILPEQNYVGIDKDLTTIYIKNPGDPFLRADEGSGTYGLIKDWFYTSNIVNQEDNQTGGFALYNGSGIVQFQTIRNQTGYSNGKMGQTITLPRGKYSFRVHFLNAQGTQYMANFVVARGFELPDNENINEAIAYAPIRQEDANGDILVNFELDEITTFTAGWIVNLDAQNTVLRFKYVKLFSSAQ